MNKLLQPEGRGLTLWNYMSSPVIFHLPDDVHSTWKEHILLLSWSLSPHGYLINNFNLTKHKFSMFLLKVGSLPPPPPTPLLSSRLAGLLSSPLPHLVPLAPQNLQGGSLRAVVSLLGSLEHSCSRHSFFVTVHADCDDFTHVYGQLN